MKSTTDPIIPKFNILNAYGYGHEEAEKFLEYLYGNHPKEFDGIDQDCRTKEETENYFPYFSYYTDPFLKALSRASSFLGRSKDLKFIDVGSGIGDKVHLANLYGLKAYGIESSKLTYRMSLDSNDVLLRIANKEKREIGTPTFINGDAFNMYYYGIDIIYMYVPIKNTEVMWKLREHIASTMSIGAVMYDVGSDPTENLEDAGYEIIGHNKGRENYLYQKIKEKLFLRALID